MGAHIVGIDIDSRVIRAVEVRNAGKPTAEIVRFGSVDLPLGAMRSGEVLEPGTVADALRLLWSTAKFSSKSVALAFGGPKAFARDIALPRMPLERIRETLPFTVQELIPLPVTEAMLDFYPAREDVLEDGPVIRGILVAAEKDAVKSVVGAVMRAKLTPVAVDLGAFALIRAIEPLGSTSDVVLIVGITASATTIVVAQSGVPRFVRLLAHGGDDITAAIARRLQVSHSQAEQAKQRFGIDATTATAAERPVVEANYAAAWDLLTGIRDTLSYFASIPNSPRVDRIVVSGDGASFPGFDAALSDVTRISVNRASIVQTARLSRTATQTAELDAYITAYGTALGVVS